MQDFPTAASPRISTFNTCLTSLRTLPSPAERDVILDNYLTTDEKRSCPISYKTIFPLRTMIDIEISLLYIEFQTKHGTKLVRLVKEKDSDLRRRTNASIAIRQRAQLFSKYACLRLLHHRVPLMRGHEGLKKLVFLKSCDHGATFNYKFSLAINYSA